MNKKIVDIINLNPPETEIFGVWLEQGICQYMSNGLNGKPDYLLKMQIPNFIDSFGYWVKDCPSDDVIWNRALKCLDDILDDPELAHAHENIRLIRNSVIEQKIEKQQVLFA